ncbi:MAG: T9SS type A sorting domain-containing protein [bacterium]
MRKTVVLALVLAAGLVLAGNEQWIGTPSQVRYDIPNPEPGIFPMGPDVFRPALDTFKYDDGMPASAWAWNTVGSGWGMKFMAPADNFTVAGALVHFYSGWPIPGGTRAMVKLFADDGPGGSPGTQLWTSDTVTVVMGQWNYVPIGEAVIGSNYYIFYVQVDSYPTCPGMSIDAFNNAPSGRKWAYSGTSFAEDLRRGDWLIRSVVDWSPQAVNASALYFAASMPPDTTPDINLFIRAMIKNLGTDNLPAGTPVRLKVTGPQSYAYEDTMLTTAMLARGQQVQMNFSPAWRVPTTSGLYTIKVWPEAAGEQYPADDTIAYALSVARWIEYANFNALNWLTWQGRARATKFDPGHFNVQYPVGLGRVRHQFYSHPSYPWPDSSFLFQIYADDGMTLLYESPEVEARPGTPGAAVAYDLDSLLVFPSGEFYVAIYPVSSTGHPSSCADDTSEGRSFAGQPGAWAPWTNGEFFTSASVQGGVGISEGERRYVGQPTLSVTGYPNPVADFLTVKWSVPRKQVVSVGLFDATGRLAHNLYSANGGPLNGAVALDVRAFPAGVYLLRLETEDGAATRKLVLR